MASAATNAARPIASHRRARRPSTTRPSASPLFVGATRDCLSENGPVVTHGAAFACAAVSRPRYGALHFSAPFLTTQLLL